MDRIDVHWDVSDPASGAPTPPSDPAVPGGPPAPPPGAPAPPPAGYGQPGYVHPAYGQPHYGPPAYGHLPYAHPYPQTWPGAGYGTSPTPSQSMAITALVLCCIFFVPLALLVGVGLAIAVLVRSRHGINYGRGKAITGLVIGVLLIAGWAALVVAAATGAFDDGTHRDRSGQVTQSGSVTVDRLRVGDCFDQQVAPKNGATIHVTTVDVVPCGESHDWEVFHSFALADGPYPGEKEAARFAEGGCVDAYKPFTGTTHSASSPSLLFLYPLQRQWTAGDRSITCVLGNVGGHFTGSLRDSGR